MNLTEGLIIYLILMVMHFFIIEYLFKHINTVFDKITIIFNSLIGKITGLKWLCENYTESNEGKTFSHYIGVESYLIDKGEIIKNNNGNSTKKKKNKKLA